LSAATATQRAVIDTNAVLDWLVFGDVDAVEVARAAAGGHLLWLATSRMRAELAAVLARPLPERWEGARKHALTIDAMAGAFACDEPPSSPGRLLCRDATDQMFIDLALAHAPAWLITRDRALLALRRRASLRSVTVCTPAQWRVQQALAPR
jgi:predicted nucleic acid-binding protein